MDQQLPLTPESFNKITQEIYKKNLELLDQKRRSEKLLYSVAEAVMAIDKSFHLTMFNRVAEKMVGKKAEDVLGVHIDEVVNILTEDGKHISAGEFCFKEDAGNTVVHNLVLPGKFKNYYINAKATLIKQSDDKDECLITLTDVTKERELDKAKDDFISIASHELRTPMTIIKSYLWMLENGKAGVLSEKQLFYLTKAVTSTQKMINLINDMLNISRMEQGRLSFKIKQFKIVDIANEVANSFELKKQEKGIYLYVDTKEVSEDAQVYSDEDKVREIITNLVGNAVKFTKKGGVTVKLKELKDYVEIAVTDTGVGISQENIQRLFQKFERLDSSYTTVAESAGTGLGLYIVKSYIENLGGQVGADSEGVNKGSTFWVTLPKFNPEPKKSAKNPNNLKISVEVPVQGKDTQ